MIQLSVMYFLGYTLMQRPILYLTTKQKNMFLFITRIVPFIVLCVVCCCFLFFDHQVRKRKLQNAT